MSRLKTTTLVFCMLILAFMLASCETTTVIVDPVTGNRTIITNDGEEPVLSIVQYWRENYSDPDALEYFDSIEEAMANHVVSHEGADTLPKTGEILKLFTSDDGLSILYFKGRDLNFRTEGIFTYTLFVKEVDGRKYYSTPFDGGGKLLDTHKMLMSRMGLNNYGEIRSGIASTLPIFSINEGERFIWGISQTSRVHYLKVDGQPVDGVCKIRRTRTLNPEVFGQLFQ